MFGFSRSERHHDMFSSLFLAYDDKMYARLCAERGVKALSLKQLAINFNVHMPLAREKSINKGIHKVKDPQRSTALSVITTADGLQEAFDGSCEANIFMRTTTHHTNNMFHDGISKQFEALQIIAGGTVTPNDRSRILTLEIKTNFTQPFDRHPEAYYYEPKQSLWLTGNGSAYKIV